MPEEPEKAKPAKKKKVRGKNGTPVAKYSPRVQQELDKLILGGYGAMRLLNFLVLSHPEIVPPSIDTMHRYKKKREKLLESDTDLRLEIERSVRDINMLGINTKDSQEVVDALFEMYVERIELIKKRNHRLGDPRQEKLLIELGSGMQDLLGMRVDLEKHGRLMQARMTTSIQLIAKHMLTGVAKVYEKLHGDKKLQEFSTGLDQMVRALDVEALEAELNESLSSGKKEVRGAA